MAPLLRCSLLLSILQSPVAAQPTNQFPTPEINVQLFASKLDRPVGLAVSGSGEASRLLVLEQTGRVVAIEVDRPSKPPIEIARAPTDDQSGRVPSMLLLDDERLLVGMGGKSRQSRGIALHNYVRGDREAAQQPQIVREIAPEGTPDQPGRYVGLAKNNKRFYVAFAADEHGGELLSGVHSRAGISDIRPLLTTRSVSNEFKPRAITLSPAGYLVVIYETSATQAAARLLFADAEPSGRSSEPAWMDLNLPGVTAVAYSPQPQPTNRRLYALADRASADQQSGLYRIDAAIDEGGRSGAKAVKIADFQQPTAMAFDDEGALYIATDTPEAGANEAGGQIWKLTGNL